MPSAPLNNQPPIKVCLKKPGSFRYDRPGMHNPFLILFRAKDAKTDHEELEPDKPMIEAITCCGGLDLDDLVEVQVTVHPGYQEKITKMMKEVVND